MACNMMAEDVGEGIDAHAEAPAGVEGALTAADARHGHYTDGHLRKVLASVRTIAMVGASPTGTRPAPSP